MRASIVGHGSAVCSAITTVALREAFVRFSGHYGLNVAQLRNQEPYVPFDRLDGPFVARLGEVTRNAVAEQGTRLPASSLIKIQSLEFDPKLLLCGFLTDLPKS